MRIEKYKCDLCGIEMSTLENTHKLDLTCKSENYEKTFTYYVCPFCASAFNIDNKETMEQFLFHRIMAVANSETK